MTSGILFWLLALLLAAATLAILLPTLWRAARAPVAPASATLALLREQLAAADLDYAQGRTDAASAERLRAEISRRLLDEQADAPAAWRADPARRTAWAVGLTVPLLAVVLYGALGDPRALSQPARQAATGQPTLTQVESMISQMTQALEARAQSGQATPEDAPAWALAARTLASLQRFKEADQAFARAIALTPKDASLLADRADILSLLQGESAEGEPMRLIERALRIDPNQPKALALAGGAAFKRGDMASAITYWRRALANLPPESEFARGLAQSLQEAQQARQAQTAAVASTSPRVPAASAPRPDIAADTSIRGRVSLSPALRAQVRPDDTVFIVARAAQGPRMPLAILRLRAADLPADFTLDDSTAMSPQMRLSSFVDVVVSARVSRTGQALPETGDLVGTPAQARIGARGLTLQIDRVQP
jgi:cytochrome c-type biogenesis protein CcmH